MDIEGLGVFAFGKRNDVEVQYYERKDIILVQKQAYIPFLRAMKVPELTSRGLISKCGSREAVIVYMQAC